MTFSQRLKELRENSGLSQLQLGKRLGITNSAISMYERGEREPDLETFAKIADYFNVSQDYLNGEDEIMYYRFDADVASVATWIAEDEELLRDLLRLRKKGDKQRAKLKKILEIIE